jgi:5-methylcytosine-specific restriction endonuclease McrA
MNPYKPPRLPATLSGICQLCRKPIFKRDGTLAVDHRLHGDCGWEAFAIFDPDIARGRVWERANGRCAACGKSIAVYYEDEGPWEMDYIISPADALPHADDPWWLWRLTNLRALCHACHLQKSHEQATRWIRRREPIVSPWPVFRAAEA